MNPSRWSFQMMLTLAASAVLFSGCAGIGKRAFAPESARYWGPLDWPSIGAALDSRAMDEPVTTLQSEWKIKIVAPEERDKVSFNANVLLQPPDHVRFRAFKLAQLVMDMLIEGPNVIIQDKMNNKVFSGHTMELADRDWLLGQLNPSELAQLLLVDAYLRDGLSADRYREAPAGREGRGGKGRLTLLSERGARLTEAVVLRTDTLLVERVGLYENRNGTLVRLPLEVRYEQYREYEGRIMPRRLKLINTQNGASITMEATKYVINPGFNPKVFVMPIRSSTPVLPLSAIWDAPDTHAP